MSISGRPLSPHIQVYKPQLTSMLSIAHRISGIALAAGAALFVIQLLAAAIGEKAFAAVQGFLGSWIGLVLLAAWSLALFFHLANGIRHLAWDVGQGYSLEATYRSGRLVLVSTLVLTALAWIGASIEWRG